MASTQTTYIETASGFLFAALDAPETGRPTRAPLLICAPWGWAETASYRGRRDWARLLADAGHAVLRFDLPGVGDSSGSPRDPELHRAWVDAIATAATWLGGRWEEFPSVTALGLGIGGLSAIEAIAAGAPVDRLALWAPPANGGTFLREQRAFSRMQTWDDAEPGGSPLAEGWVEASGFVLSAETAESLRALDPTAIEIPSSLRMALLLGREGTPVGAPLREHLEAAGVAVESRPGPGWEVMISQPAFSRASAEVIDALAGWLADGEVEVGPGAAAPAEPLGPRTVELDRAGKPVRESLFSFPLDRGAGFGVVAEPATGPAAETCGVFLNAAAVRHIGPNRLWVDAARELAAQGIRSARVDFAGIGESDGDGARFAEEAEFFAPDQIAQVGAILDQLEAAGLGKRFLVIGLCSGGYWAFRGALEDPRVERVLLLNPGAFRWRPTLLMERQGHGFSTLFRRDLWARLARGELGVRKIGSLLRLLVARTASASRRSLTERAPAAGEERPPDRELEADFDLLQSSGKRATIAFTDNEVLLQESRRHSTLDELDRWPNIDLVTLPGVDHALAPTSAQRFAGELIVAQFERSAGAADAG